MDKTRAKPLVIIQSYEDRNSGKELNQTISERLSSFNQRETLQDKSTTAVNRQGNNVATPPPPPPPLPLDDVDEVDSRRSPSTPTQKIKPPPPPVPQKTTTNQPPPCPTPDYDTLSISSTATLPKKSSVNGFSKKEIRHTVSYSGDSSIDINSNNYFKSRNSTSQLQNGTNTNAIKQRSVSVTIGEYPSGTSRKQPKKLDFLNGRENNSNRSPSQSIVNQFASELAQTLNRSNLRKKTESMENLLNHPQIKANTGSVRISVNSSLSKHLAKSTNDLSSLDNYSKTVSNRVTINIPPNDKKTETPNGILKYNNGNHHNLPTHRSVLHQKSITFGEIPTVINDKALHVT